MPNKRKHYTNKCASFETPHNLEEEREKVSMERNGGVVLGSRKKIIQALTSLMYL